MIRYMVALKTVPYASAGTPVVLRLPEAPKESHAEPIPTIDDLKALQGRLGLCDEHVVWIGPSWFVVAHTDEERATIDLEDCELHGWLHGLDGPPAGEGYYVAMRREPDAYSEPYNAAPWDFVPVAEAQHITTGGHEDA